MTATSKVLGMSMAPRKNRRWLVAVTYAFTLACEALLLTLVLEGRAFWRWGFPWSLAGFAVMMAPCLILCGLLPNMWLFRRPYHVTGLGLAPIVVEEAEPDERELMMENAAFRKAFYAIAFYLIILIFACPLSFSIDLTTPASKGVIFFLISLLEIMIFTLPQAIILWTEPDVPEETGSVMAA